MTNRWNRLKARWGVTNAGVVAILVAFSAAGMSVLKVTHPIMAWILPPSPPAWLWWTCRILVIVPVYYVLLLGYGTLLGQRRFFWGRMRRLLPRSARPSH
jgi:hypothetical protein